MPRGAGAQQQQQRASHHIIAGKAGSGSATAEACLAAATLHRHRGNHCKLQEEDVGMSRAEIQKLAELRRAKAAGGAPANTNVVLVRGK